MIAVGSPVLLLTLASTARAMQLSRNFVVTRHLCNVALKRWFSCAPALWSLHLSPLVENSWWPLCRYMRRSIISVQSHPSYR